MCVRVCVRMYVRACMRACVCLYEPACMRISLLYTLNVVYRSYNNQPNFK